MPIDLTTNYTDGPKTYTHVGLIVDILNPYTKEIAFDAVFGTLDPEGNFLPSSKQNRYHIENRSAHIGPGNVQVPENNAYDAIAFSARTTPDDELVEGDGGHSIYRGLGRELYEWIQSAACPDNALYAGDIIF